MNETKTTTDPMIANLTGRVNGLEFKVEQLDRLLTEANKRISMLEQQLSSHLRSESRW